MGSTLLATMHASLFTYVNIFICTYRSIHQTADWCLRLVHFRGTQGLELRSVGLDCGANGVFTSVASIFGSPERYGLCWGARDQRFGFSHFLPLCRTMTGGKLKTSKLESRNAPFTALEPSKMRFGSLLGATTG